MADVNVRLIITDGVTGVLNNISESVLPGLVSAAAFTATAIAATLGAAFATLGIFLKESVESASDAELALVGLETVLKSTGGVAGITSEQAQLLAANLQDVSMFSDEAALSAEAMLLRFENITADIFPEALKLTADLAASLGTDLTTAARQVGMALDDPTAGIGRLNTQFRIFTEEEMKAIKAMAEAGDVAGAQALIMDGLREKVGGAAEALGDTFAGKLEIFRNKLDDIREIIGGPIIEVLSRLLDRVIEIINTNPALQEFLGFFTTLADYLNKDFPFLTSLGFTLINFRDSVPWFRDLGFALIDLQGELQKGVPLWDALKTTLTELAENDNPLGNISQSILNFLNVGGTEGWDVAIGGVVSSLFNKMAEVLDTVNWTPITDTIINVIGSILVGVGNTLAVIITGIDWKPVGEAIKNALGEMLRGALETTIGSVWYEHSAQELVNGFITVMKEEFILRTAAMLWIGNDIITGLINGIQNGFITNLYKFSTMIDNHIIKPFKDALGIGFPSKIFAGFGGDIVQGLINGLTGAWSGLLTTIRTKIQEIINLFPQWLQDFLGIDGGLSAAGIGVASGGSAGSLGGTSGTLTSTATQNYYNYYYGNVYFQGTGQTNGGVDCQYPNPVLSATASGGPVLTPQ